MSITVSLNHITHYTYDKPVQMGMQTIRLRPAPHVRLPIDAYSLKISPDEHFINWQQDPFGNFLAKVVFPEKVSEFKIVVDLKCRVRAFNPFDFFVEDNIKSFPFKYDDESREELSPYLEIKDNSKELKAFLAELDKSERNINDFLVDVNQSIHKLLKYTIRLEPGVQTCAETLNIGSGSCRDMAWLMIQAFRHLGIASRFASGYSILLKQDVKPLDGPCGVEEDVSDLHAWCEVYLPGAGWVGLDPTSGLFAGEGHIPLCCTPNPSSAAPVSGTLESGAKSQMHHEMNLVRLLEAPRVTKPYSEAQWQAIDNLGHQVDQDLSNSDVRLTMGGEPTFVSVDDRESQTWHYDALDDINSNKKYLAKDLLYRLKSRFANGALHMFTQGKWYPGEILPRWAMPCFWRKDGEAIWQDQQWLADPDVSLGHDVTTAQNFLNYLAEKLNIPSSYVKAAKEDAPYYLWQEGKLPISDEFTKTDHYGESERKRLLALLETGLNNPVGYVLPLHFSQWHNRWISNDWQFNTNNQDIVLLTGDSPMGLRLPTASLPHPANAFNEQYFVRNPFDHFGNLASHAELHNIVKARYNNNYEDQSFHHDLVGMVRTALCIEPRNGVLHVFLPPQALIENFLELIIAIEQTCSELGLSVVLEGYTPPKDSRVEDISVTPDPGVIEVNVQPAHNWQQLKNITNTVYEEARQARLSTEKFLVDGGRVGTGGGNHIVLGAEKPEDSPFLRRPNLLRSMLAFWQNHPSLSYLFAGLYIGATSQAPRVDEARHESLYELEIAFRQVDNQLMNHDLPAWVVDRLFRNLLVDLTGNTHRAEFCIDKLYSPDSYRGRLGLLEMRGFEMTPHPRMNLLQALLVRACIAIFWNNPYKGKLIRWGTQLHDKFMLPHYLEEDFKEVLFHLRGAGYHFDFDWFKPFFAFRFPEYGTIKAGGVDITLQLALEPWHVMGEESNGASVSRSVDSSLERLQVKVKGFIPDQHLLTCNGKVVPLHNGVAGVRFKAWSQPSSLHPMLYVNAPLTFDLIDVTQQVSLGGCVYHVSHPGGRSYDTFPINENEAEGRKIVRFEGMGHSGGYVNIPMREYNNEFPHTLDLRLV